MSQQPSPDAANSTRSTLLSLYLPAFILALGTSFGLPFSVFVVALIVVSLTQSYTGGSMQTLASDIAPAHARGKFFGLWNLTGQGGTFISPAAFAFIGEAFGAQAGFFFLAFTSVMASTLVGFFVSETVRRPRASVATV